MIQYVANLGVSVYIKKLCLQVTRNCTLECEHCLRGDRENKFMSFETIANILRDVDEIDELLFTGGEPLLAIDQILKTIEIIKNNNIKVRKITIMTNGTILNKSVRDAIRRLSNIAELSLELSSDVFHVLELVRLNLYEKWRKDSEVYFNELNANRYDWGIDDGTIKIDDDYFCPILETGRAKTISKERLREINSLLNDHFYFVIWDSRILSRNEIILNYDSKTNRANGIVYVNVNGNVVPWNMSFNEEDEDAERYSSNINKIGLLNAILNYRDYYIKYFSTIGEREIRELNELRTQRILEILKTREI